MPGPAPAPCKPGTFKTANDLCGGLQKNSAGDASAKACAGACCGEAGCMTWQWLGGKTHGAGCWIGTCAKPGHPSKTWVGGQRVGPPPAPGPPSPTPPTACAYCEKFSISARRCRARTRPLYDSAGTFRMFITRFARLNVSCLLRSILRRPLEQQPLRVRWTQWCGAASTRKLLVDDGDEAQRFDEVRVSAELVRRCSPHARHGLRTSRHAGCT